MGTAGIVTGGTGEPTEGDPGAGSCETACVESFEASILTSLGFGAVGVPFVGGGPTRVC